MAIRAMVVIEKATTLDGVIIQLEEWYNGLYIGAYPIARNNSYNKWIKCGEIFRLTIGNNPYKNYT